MTSTTPVTAPITPPWADADDSPRITDVRTFITAPEGLNLVVVQVDTDTPGLQGLGCATFTFRAKAVETVVQDYLAPRVIGRSVRDVTDIFRSLELGPYWRGGPIENSALSGIDMALWDIKGKLANMPVWSLLGGLTRAHLPTYISVFAPDLPTIVERVGLARERGHTRVRPMVQGPDHGRPQASGREYIAATVRTLELLERELGDGQEYVVDVHGRLEPQETIELARALEPFDLVYLEDPFPPEHLGWLATLRDHTTHPIAIGEVFTTVDQYLPGLASRSIDVVRSHLSMIGGFTPAIGLAHLAAHFGAQIAWHGPSDLSPVGHAANAALGFASPNLRIHEHHEPSEAVREIFRGAPSAANGVIEPSIAPGWGVEFDAHVAAKYPAIEPSRTSVLEAHRDSAGSIRRP
ncbi:enolase C-terminal domain-like protein [Isoptericola sp. NPDC057391]|uniref:enolase C-terminal domain-like protein n=1 Tax=Isoptericola sp. NPDC057391 TaxID=3346117 RepID=UPI0036404E6D